MSNEVATFAQSGNLPSNPADLAAGLQNMTTGIQTASTQPILRLLREGIFVYGQENIEVEEGSQWAINPYSIEHGFAAWGEGELFGEVMVPLTTQPPAVGSLPDHGVPWLQQISMQIQCMSGQDKGVTVLYKSTSKGFLSMAKTLCAQIINQVQVDPEHIVPLVTFDMDYYQHKKYGKIFTPVLEIDDWLSIDTAEPAEAEEAEAEPEPPKNKRAKKAKAEKDEPPFEPDADPAAETEAAPTRRRRRRA